MAGTDVALTSLEGIGRLFTATEDGPVDDATVVFDSREIRWIGSDGARPPARVRERIERTIDAAGALVTPGLVDAHCHPLYAAPRLDELAVRTAGIGYAEIAAAGGGIRRTVNETRLLAPWALDSIVTERLAAFLANGTTTVETKTGYHLTIEGELFAVEVLNELRDREDLPDVSITFLAAHDVPPEYAGRRSDWVAEVAAACPEAARRGANAVDVFVDEGFFTVEEARTILESGASAGLAIRPHADELARTGGAKLAAQLGAQSADHLLRLDAAGAAALAKAGTVATLCPLTALAMKRQLPLDLLMEAGCTIALGSDHNPGQTGVTSMATVVWAATTMGMAVSDALRAATVGSAAALGLGDRGRIEPGARADLVAWPVAHEGGFAWDPALPATIVLKGGREIATLPPV
jgi:imidazolonepropionase